MIAWTNNIWRGENGLDFQSDRWEPAIYFYLQYIFTLYQILGIEILTSDFIQL